MFASISAAISHACGLRCQPDPARSVHGGCINECYRWETDAGPLFVKITRADALDMLEAEAAGLCELEQAAAVRVPRVRAVGLTGDRAWLALEWVDLRRPSAAVQRLLGERLARQHRHVAQKFGWHRDNTIGSTPQPNDWHEDWVSFFRERRLRHQLRLAQRNGYGGRLQEDGARLLERLEEFFDGYRPVPSLLHGDLWGGNFGADAGGSPVIFDPAVYYGDREADLAMTRLFGGFGREFHAAYQAAWPLDHGAEKRITLYNLYHVLNHLNLFGGGYRAQAEAMIGALLAR